MKAALLVALAGCSVPALSLDGKPCPCAGGYTCNTATNKCEATIDAAKRDAPGLGCLGTAPGASVYALGTFDWTKAAGTWTGSGASVAQTDATANLAFATALPSEVAPSLAGFRVVVDMTGSAGGEYLGVAFRVTGTGAQQYDCMFSPGTGINGTLAFDVRNNPGNIVGTPLLVTGLTDSGTSGTYRLEVLVSNGSIKCCIDGIANATLSTTDTTYASGEVGLVTSLMSATFASFAVYAN